MRNALVGGVMSWVCVCLCHGYCMGMGSRTSPKLRDMHSPLHLSSSPSPHLHSSSLHFTFLFCQRLDAASIRMPILTPLCAAAGPGNTVYTFALASNYGNYVQLPRGDYYVIVKSNANPTSLTEMTWSIVAAISSSALGMSRDVTSCAVSDQGVVTIFDYWNKVIRYDPSATPNGGTISTGPGGWMNITVSSNTYSRIGIGWRSLAFYVKDTAAGGAQKLIQLIVRRSITPTLQFWIVDETTKTLSNAANWTMNDAYPNVYSLAYSNNELYLYMTSGSTLSKVSVYPLTGLTSTVPSNPRTLDTTTTSNICSSSRNILSGVWGNSYHLLCTYSATESRDNTLYTISNITQNGSSAGSGINIPTALDMIDYFIPVASTPYFAFMLDAEGGYLSPGMYGIQVSEVGAGTVRSADLNLQDLNVPTYRAYPTTYPTDRNTDSGSDSTGAIIGVFIGILVVVVVVITVCCYRKRSSDNNNEKEKHAAETTANQEYNGRHNSTEMKGQETPHIVEPAVIPMIQVPGMNGPHQMNRAGQPHPAGVYPQMPGQPMYPMPQPAPIAISDAMTITPAANAVSPSQPGQDQLQHLQFSSHPRPNFVTSVGDNDQSNGQKQEVDSGNNSVTSASPNVSLSASYNPGWEPQPWSPPTRPASNNVNSSTLTERSLPPLPSHEASPNLMQGSPGTVGSNNPYHNLGPT
ncbi:MAG: hypothetical protein J3Q66DRAFT_343429 [Benniella sp.]|nr:MAG: hypothetical protein J3Q66DRAFT_343429 [Benniella sp.]